jgi:hypothetical protein
MEAQGFTAAREVDAVTMENLHVVFVTAISATEHLFR